MLLKQQTNKLRILDFDIENRPLSYWVPDQPTAEITAIASCWADDVGSMEVYLLGIHSYEEILESFVKRYKEADIVTGHYIRRHDLPIINGALLELGWEQLGPKLSCDTKLDMTKKQGIPANQEYLIDLFGLGTKVHMSQVDWRSANRLTPEGIEATRKRVTGDVYDHMRLRPEMIKRGLLRTPKIWHG